MRLMQMFDCWRFVEANSMAWRDGVWKNQSAFGQLRAPKIGCLYICDTKHWSWSTQCSAHHCCKHSILLGRPRAQRGHWNECLTLWQSLLYSVIQTEASLGRKILFQSFLNFSYKANLLGVQGSRSFLKFRWTWFFNLWQHQSGSGWTCSQSLSQVLKCSVFLLTALDHISSSKRKVTKPWCHLSCSSFYSHRHWLMSVFSSSQLLCSL